MMKILILLGFLMGMPSLAMAQNHSAYCKTVDSTAASQQCLTYHLKSAQARLNKVYKKLGETLEEERLVALKDIQKSWLTYRDAECMWEAGHSEGVSLKRVNELSCMARITEDRADLLTVAYGDVARPETQSQWGGFPIWMNAVAKEYPAIYWDYGSRLEGDVNCNGQDEQVMTGIKMGKEAPEIQLVVVENPLVGKPKPTLFSFPVVHEAQGDVEEGMEKKEPSEHDICSDVVRVEMIKSPVREPVEGDEKKESGNAVEEVCQASLHLISKGCAPKVVNWTGKGFDIAVEKEPTDKKETEKK